MKTSFLGAAYESRSLPLACQTLVNLLYEPAAPGSAEEGMFYGSPGTVLHVTCGAGPVRGMHSAGGYLWVVSGTNLYRVSGTTPSLVGTIAGSGRVSMAHNDTQLVIAHAAGWNVVTLATSVMAAVADAPLTAQVAYQDGYIVFPNANGTYGWTALADASTLDALSFASAEANPDRTIAVLSDHRELWLFGETTTEVAQTTSDADLPFTRTAMIEHGCAAKYSPAKADNTVFWLGRDANGQGVVFRADGYAPSRISTYALEAAIAGTQGGSGYTVETAYGYCYQQAGHTFYVLCFDEATWAYDIGTGRWSQLGHLNSLTGRIERHRGGAYAFHAGQHLLGDHNGARVYRLDLDAYTDDGDEILRERTWSVIEAEGRWIRHDCLQLMAEMGVGLSTGQGDDPIVRLQWTDDGGRTWSSARELKLGRIGAFRNRAMARRLGLSRNRVYRLRITDPVKVCLYGANLDAAPANR